MHCTVCYMLHIILCGKSHSRSIKGKLVILYSLVHRWCMVSQYKIILKFLQKAEILQLNNDSFGDLHPTSCFQNPKRVAVSGALNKVYENLYTFISFSTEAN